MKRVGDWGPGPPYIKACIRTCKNGRLPCPIGRIVAFPNKVKLNSNIDGLFIYSFFNLIYGSGIAPLYYNT